MFAEIAEKKDDYKKCISQRNHGKVVSCGSLCTVVIL